MSASSQMEAVGISLTLVRHGCAISRTTSKYMSFIDCCNERDMYTSTLFAIAKCEQLSCRMIALPLRSTVHLSWRKVVPKLAGRRTLRKRNCVAKRGNYSYGRKNSNPSLCGADGVHPVRIKHVAQGNYAFKFMDVGPIDYRQNVDMSAAHAFQRDMKSMVSMHVGKLQCIQQA